LNLQVLLSKDAKDLFMRTLVERFVRGESGAIAPRVVDSTQINPLEMMANAKDLPTSLATA
jgi:hypothetical protein